MKGNAPVLFCERGDRHEPRIKCGYPLPCPFHTTVIDAASGTVTNLPADEAGIDRILEIARVLKD